MKFTVIVPVYNVAQYLSECIDSILRQSYKDFELILIDDGSTDSSPDICDRYAEKDGRVIVLHQQNSGVVVARQKGVQMARGDYLVFVDGDDTITSDCLRTINEYAYVDIIRFGYICETKKGISNMPMPDRKGYYGKEDIEREIFPKLIQTEDARYFSPGVCGGAFRKNLFAENMLTDIRLAIGEDGACVMPCVYHAQSMFILEECLYFYRRNISSATKGRKAFSWDVPEQITDHLCKKIDISEYDFQEQLYRKIVHELFSVVISQFYRKEKNSVIKKDIRTHLEYPLYKDAIEKAKFKGSHKAALMHSALKHKWFMLMKLYSRIK